MHPELMLDLIHQRSAEFQARAREARLTRAVRKLRHAQRDLAQASSVIALPEIPDYVRDMFGDGGVSGDAGHVPTQRPA
jgi:hypothetical protein